MVQKQRTASSMGGGAIAAKDVEGGREEGNVQDGGKGRSESVHKGMLQDGGETNSLKMGQKREGKTNASRWSMEKGKECFAIRGRREVSLKIISRGNVCFY
jgi:hypothetical protein